MKKYRVLFVALCITSTPILSAQKSRTVRACCGLDDIAYTISSRLGCNDYYYLASKNYSWHLQKKIALKDEIKKLDAHYPYHATKIQHECIILHQTPLHAAIKMGNIECIKLLLAAGANVSKVIQYTSKDARVGGSETEFDKDWARCPKVPFLCDIFNPLQWVGLIADKRYSLQKLQRMAVYNFKKAAGVELSAVQLAQKLFIQAAQYTGQASYETRATIADLLEKHLGEIQKQSITENQDSPD